jgi:CHAD domain-containing protein
MIVKGHARRPQVIGMAHLSKDKSPGKSIRKQLNKRVQAALDILGQGRLEDADIHQARKALKKARAYLRLLRPGLKDSVYRLENGTLRDAARPLSSVRDARVLLDTLQALGKRYGEPMRVLKLDGLKKALKNHHARTRHEILDTRGGALAHSRRLLRESRSRIENLDLQQDDWATVGAGLKDVYAKGQRALADARNRPSPETFHEWRKQAKHLRYALEMLEPLWPGFIGGLAHETHQLADHLGDEHDLTVLRGMSLGNRASFKQAPTLSALLALIDRDQGEMREKALPLGSRLYGEKPKAFAERFRQYWKLWRSPHLREPTGCVQ